MNINIFLFFSSSSPFLEEDNIDEMIRIITRWGMLIEGQQRAIGEHEQKHQQL